MVLGNLIEAKKLLQQRIHEGTQAPADPSTLMREEIERFEDVFQHRGQGGWMSDDHVRTLTKALNNSNGKPFDPVTVFWVGNGWVLVDGHHRMQAYIDAMYHNPIPVQVFHGSLDEAIGEALKANSRNKLPMSTSEKANAAWRLVVGAHLSINKTADAAGISRQTVITMRKTRDTLLQKHRLEDLADWSWWDARMGFQREDDRTFDTDWLEKEAAALAATLVKKHGRELSKQPEVLWRALEIYDSRLTDCFLELNRLDPSTGMLYEEDENPDF